MGAGAPGLSSALDGEAPDVEVMDVEVMDVDALDAVETGARAALSGRVSGSILGSVVTTSGCSDVGGAEGDGVVRALSFSARARLRSRYRAC